MVSGEDSVVQFVAGGIVALGEDTGNRAVLGLAVPGDDEAGTGDGGDRWVPLFISRIAIDLEFLARRRAVGIIALTKNAAVFSVLVVAIPDHDKTPIAPGTNVGALLAADNVCVYTEGVIDLGAVGLESLTVDTGATGIFVTALPNRHKTTVIVGPDPWVSLILLGISMHLEFRSDFGPDRIETLSVWAVAILLAIAVPDNNVTSRMTDGISPLLMVTGD